MTPMHTEYWLDVFRLEYQERLRAAGRRHLAAPVRPPSTPLRRRFGSALIRLGLRVGGPTLAPPHLLVPAHRGGPAR